VALEQKSLETPVLDDFFSTWLNANKFLEIRREAYEIVIKIVSFKSIRNSLPYFYYFINIYLVTFSFIHCTVRWTLPLPIHDDVYEPI